jgi:hypothetical protein
MRYADDLALLAVPLQHRRVSLTCSPKAARLLLSVLSGRVSLPVTMPVACSSSRRSIVLPHL